MEATHLQEHIDHSDTLDLAGCWAASLAWHEGHPWIAWIAAIDPEPDLLAGIAHSWPLRSGVTEEEWRRRSAGAAFAVSLRRLDDLRAADGNGRFTTAPNMREPEVV